MYDNSQLLWLVPQQFCNIIYSLLRSRQNSDYSVYNRFCAQYLQDQEQFYIKPQDCVLEQTQAIFCFGTIVVVVSLVSLFLAGSSPTLLQP